MRTTNIAGRTWRFSHAIGRQTAEHNGMTGGCAWPVAVAVAPGDIIFILSRGWGREIPGYGGDIYKRVSKTTLDEHHLGDFARCGFTWPAGLALDSAGMVYVSDEYENRIKVFDPNATFEFPFFNPDGEAVEEWGEAGPEPGKLNAPNGLAFDANDDLYIVDSGNARVQKFTKHGEFLSTWGEPGDGPGQFNRPWGVTIDKKGDIYVADWGNNRVQKFTCDGQYLMSFGTSDGTGGELDHPADVAVDSDGDVYVTDWGNRRVQIYEPNGEVLTALYGDARELSKAGEYAMARNDGKGMKNWDKVDDAVGAQRRFDRPVGIAIDAQNRIIVTDIGGRLQVYVKDHSGENPFV